MNSTHIKTSVPPQEVTFSNLVDQIKSLYSTEKDSNTFFSKLETLKGKIWIEANPQELQDLFNFLVKLEVYCIPLDILQIITTFKKLLLLLKFLNLELNSNYPFGIVENALLSFFGEIWAHLARVNKIPKNLLGILPWREVETTLSDILSGGTWPSEALTASIELSKLRLRFCEDVVENFQSTGNFIRVQKKWKDFVSCVKFCKSPKDLEKMDKLITHLDTFCLVLRTSESPIKTPDNANVELDMSTMRNDMYSLNRILKYIRICQLPPAENEDSLTDLFILQRALQVVGESLKDTVDSPNISKRISKKAESAGVPLNLLKELRNKLSHFNLLLLRKRKYSEEKRKEFIQGAKEDLKVLGNAFTKMLEREEFHYIKARFLVKDGMDNFREGIVNSRNFQELQNVFEGLEDLNKDYNLMVQQSRIREYFAIPPLESVDIPQEICEDMENPWASMEKNDLTKLHAKSSITEITQLEVIPKLFQHISSSAAPDQQTNSFRSVLKNDAGVVGDLFYTFFCTAQATVESKCHNVYHLASKELLVGASPDYTYVKITDEAVHQTVYTNCGAEVTQEAKDRAVSTLLLLNKMKQAAEPSEPHSQFKSAVIKLLARARDGTFSAVEVDKLTPEIPTEGQRGILCEVLLKMRTAVDEDLEFEVLMSQIARECGVEFVSAVEISKGDPEFEKARFKMQDHLHHIKNHPNEQALITEESFHALKLTLGTKNVKIQSTYNQIADKDFQALNRLKPFYKLLLARLKGGNSMKESCKHFNTYLSSLKIEVLLDSEAKVVVEKASSLFASNQRLKFQEFFLHRLQQLRALLQKANIVQQSSTKGNGPLQIKPEGLESFRRNSRIKAAAEMMLLDCLEILQNLQEGEPTLESESLICLFPAISSSNFVWNIKFRNYLAHGDNLLDSLGKEMDEHCFRSACNLVIYGEAMLALKNLARTRNVYKFLQDCVGKEEYKIHEQSLLEQAGNVVTMKEEISKSWTILKSSCVWQNLVKQSVTLSCQHFPLTLAQRIQPEVFDPDEILLQEAFNAIYQINYEKLKILHGMFKNIGKMRLKNNNWTILHSAVSMGDKSMVAQICDYDIDINAADIEGITPLHLAVLNQNLEFLQNDGIDINLKTTFGVTPIHIAAQQGSVEMLKCLLQSGKADVNCANKVSCYPLHLAANYGQDTCAELLLANGALVNVVQIKGMFTPLHLAAYEDNVDLMRTLINHGADVYPILRGIDYFDQKSVIHLVASFGSKQSLELLLSRGVDINFAVLHTKNMGRWTALTWAVLYGREDMVKLIAQVEGVQLHFKDREECPMVTAAVQRHPNYKDMVNLLMSLGLEAPITMLPGAVGRGDVEMTKFLITLVDPRKKFRVLRPPSECTLPEIAVMCGQLEMLQYLLGNRTLDDPEERQNLLVEASRYGHIDILDYLLKRLGDTTETKGLMCYAATQNNLAIVEYLLSKTDMEETDNRHHTGYTPSMLAARYKSTSVLEFLLKNRADLTGHKGLSIIASAAKNGQWGLVKDLINRGIDYNKVIIYEYEMTNIPALAACKGQDEFLNYLIREKGFDLKTLLDEREFNFVKMISQLGTMGMLDFLKSKGLDLSTPDHLGISGLHYAALVGNKPAVQFFVDILKMDVNIRNKEQETPVHYFLRKVSEPSVLKFLLEKKAEADAKDSKGLTPIALACKLGTITLNNAKLLVEHGADVTFNDKGYSLLHLHLNNKVQATASIVAFLLEMGAPCNIFCTTPERQTYLHLAAAQRNEDVIKTILEKAKEDQAKFSEFLNAQDINGDTAVIINIKCNGKEVANLKYVVNYGDHMFSRITESLKLLLASKPDLNIQNKDGDTALHFAVKTDFRDLLFGLIIDGKPDPRITNNEGKTACDLSPSSATSIKLQAYECPYREEVLKDPEAIEQRQKRYEESLLKSIPFSVRQILQNFENDPPYLHQILESNLNLITTLSPRGWPLIHEAASMGFTTIVGECLNRGVNINVKISGSSDSSNEEATPLHLACRNGWISTVQKLVEKGADPKNVVKTPCEEAIENGHLEIVKFLVDKFGDCAFSKDAILYTIGTSDSLKNLETIKYVLDYHIGKRGPEVVFQFFKHILIDEEDGVRSLILLLSKLIFYYDHLKNAKFDMPKSPLEFCARQKIWRRTKPIVENCSGDIITWLVQDYSNNVLIKIVENQNLDFLKFVGRKVLGINFNVPGRMGERAIISAVKTRNVEIVKFLLEAKVNTNVFLYENGNTPLHIISTGEEDERSREIRSLLLAKGACPDVINKAGDIPFIPTN